MLRCPQCNKALTELARKCPTCQADLDMLVDLKQHLDGALQKADALARSGELGQAFWAYLEVLDVHPENGVARKQVGQVVNTVRVFDRFGDGRWRGKSGRRVAWHWWYLAVAALWTGLVFYLGVWAGNTAWEDVFSSDPNQETLKPRAPSLDGK